MQVPPKPGEKKKQAYVLIVTLAFLIVTLIVLASIMTWIMSNSAMTERNNEFLGSEYAAEAATEKVLGQMEYDWMNGTLGSASSYATLVPNANTTDWPVQYVYSDTNGDTNEITVIGGTTGTNWIGLPNPYVGLNAYVTPYTVTATAKPIGERFNVPATVTQTFDITQIPIFQYLIFYNMNLEIAAARALDVNGPVFSNAGIWTAQNLTFDSTVWAVQQAVNGGTDPFVTYSGSGSSTYTLRGQPISGANHVTMPISGTNNNPSVVESILQWPPSAFSLGSSAAYSGNGEVYLANFADLIISNAASGVSMTTPTGTNLFVYYEDQYQTGNSNHNNFCSTITWVTNNYYLVTNVGKGTLLTYGSVPASRWTNSGNVYQVWYAGYSFLTNALFYDWREGWTSGSAKSVQAVQLDVGQFNAWLATNIVNGGSNYNARCLQDKNHSIGGVYIYNSVPLSTTVLPAVRLVNGSELFDNFGFSVATPMPLYVLGDFNVTDGSGVSDTGTTSTLHSMPASLLADAITILSSAWNDGNSQSTKKPAASSETTIDAACLEGIVPSDPNLPSGGDNSNYSGGVENFLRLLESWGNLYYSGSIVVMFPSQYATNRWRQTGNFYGAPTRNWSFDTNFTVRTELPPFTPEMKTTIRSTWAGN